MLKMKRFNNGKNGIFSYLFMLLCVVIALYPIVWVILSSFKTNKEILSNGLSLPTSFSFIAYQQAITISPIPLFFVNSIVITTLSTVINVFAMSMAGYVFARMNFRGKNLLFAILLISLVIPMTSLLLPVFLIVNRLGLYDTKAALIIVYAALSLPLSLLVLRRSFESVPKGLEEAAYIDGAGFFRTYIQIMVPVAKAGHASAAVLAFLNGWNEFTFALVLTSSESSRTLPLSLSYFTSQFSFNYSAMFAAITIAVIPSIIIFALFQESIISSLSTGSMKG